METDFLSSLKSKDTDILVLEEPSTGFGFPDLVVLVYEKRIADLWSCYRNQLTNDDLRLLYYLNVNKKAKCLESLTFETGHTLKAINTSINRLMNANLIRTTLDGRLKAKPLKELFFLQEIISIEAKITDWKGAIQQTENNSTFSSKSFSLFPSSLVSKNIITAFKSRNLGLISFDEDYIIQQRPTRRPIPSSFQSWIFNEYAGREVYGRQTK
ncbi:MAG: hypothetical protein VB954_03275 [Thalassolituus sp.]|uniref:hypothetical protein n=1 Tax=Thalassolituus sp. TaxID=2030822 RepID=UPI0039822475